MTLIIPGLGHVYAARLASGFFYYIGIGVTWLIFWVGVAETATDNTTAAVLLWFLIPLIFYLVNVVHAYISTRRFNERNQIRIK